MRHCSRCGGKHPHDETTETKDGKLYHVYTCNFCGDVKYILVKLH